MKTTVICVTIGFLIGVLGISYSFCHYFYGESDNFEGAMGVMFIFGLPLSIIGAISSNIYIMGIVFMANWILLGILCSTIVLMFRKYILK